MVERYRPKNEPEVEAAKTAKSTRGRPSQYEEKYANIAQQLCSHGATDADLADAFGVSTVTIFNWTSKYPEFKAAVAHGKAAVFDPKVERSLAQLALGYSVDCEEVKVTKDGGIIRYPIRKHFKPDVTACIFWLKNRKPEQWRDVYSHEHNAKKALDETNSQELLEEIRKEAAALGLVPPDGKSSAQKTRH